ncbi:MAG: hypothetical protein IKE38_02945 [Erysipelotrichaceae bacterium]|nr:hypothetical protein [Erysipelotrichaceae bacterium]
MSETNTEMTPVLESWRSPKENIYDRFTEELGKWSKSGAEPFDASQDVRFCLDLEEKRQRENGIFMSYDMEAIGTPAMQTGRVLGGALTPYNGNIHYRSGIESLSFSKDGNVLYDYRKDVVFYETILDAETDADLDGHPYACPNCGGATTIGELLRGACPYCGTQFIMSDLYPKVSSFYAIESVPAPEIVKKKAARYPAIGAVIGAAFGLFSGIISDYLKMGFAGILLTLFYMLLMGGIAAFIMYILYSLSLLGRLFIMAGKSMPMLPALGSNKKLNDRLSVYDPAFSVEYFSSKAISLYKAIVFSQNAKELTFYKGPKPDENFKNIIHSDYKGGVGVSLIEEIDGKICVALDLYLTNYYFLNGKVRAKEEKIKLGLRHDKEFKVSDSFSIMSVECKGCGGSFKAAYQKHCPYCGREYDVSLDDWEVVYLKK